MKIFSIPQPFFHGPQQNFGLKTYFGISPKSIAENVPTDWNVHDEDVPISALENTHFLVFRLAPFFVM